MRDCTSRLLLPRFATLLLSALRHVGAASNRSSHRRPFGWAVCLSVSCPKSRIAQKGHPVPHLLSAWPERGGPSIESDSSGPGVPSIGSPHWTRFELSQRKTWSDRTIPNACRLRASAQNWHSH